MKKIIFFLALIFMASVSYLTAQNLVQHNQEVTLGKPEVAPEQNASKADYTLKYYATGATIAGLGNANFGVGTFYSHGCISFTPAQMYNYTGGSLSQINFYFPSAAQNPSLVPSSGKVWIKNSLTGEVLYEQSCTVTPSTWNNVPLTTTFPLTASNGLVIGFSVTHITTSGTANEIRPVPLTTTGDSYKSGGANYIIGATVPNTNGVGAAWNVYTSAGNIAIEGLVTGSPTLPTNDLSTVSVSTGALKWVGTPSTFSVAVYNSGTASQNNYIVQIIDAANTVLGSTPVITALASGAFANVEVTVTPAAAGNLAVRGKVVLSGDAVPGNDITDPVTLKIYPQQPMAYCTNTVRGFLTAAASYIPCPVNGAIGYPAANITPFVGKRITAIDLYIDAPASIITEATVWVRSALTGTNLVTQTFTPVTGWNSVTLATPYDIINANTFIGYTYTVNASGPYPMAISENTQNAANGGHYLIGATTGTWSTLSTQAYPGNWALIGVVETPANLVAITTAVNPENFGTVTGGGNYTIGNPVTLTAIEKPWSTFVNWTPGNSTANPFTFNAATDITYTANFSGTPPPCDDYIIGTGTTSYFDLPTDYMAYSYTQQIYLASEIDFQAGAIIEELSFQYTSATPLNRPNMTFYLGNTSKATFSSTTDWILPPNLQQVYQGTVVFDNTGTDNWYTITLQTPFEYTGGNIVVVCHNAAGSSGTTSSNFLAHDLGTGTNRTIHHWSSSVLTNPDAPPTANGTISQRNNVKFYACSYPVGDCNPATNLTVNYNTDCNSATLAWTAPGKGSAKMPIFKDGVKPPKKDLIRTAREPITKPTGHIAPTNKSTIILFEDFESANVPSLPTGWTRSQTGQSDLGWTTDDMYYWGYDDSWVYAWSEYDDVTRNAWMYTPALALTAGTEYTISFWLWGGYDVGDYNRFEVKIANSATATAMNAGYEFYRTTQLFTYDDWVQISGTYTPTTSGNFYLGFHDFTNSDYGYDILIDDVLITDGSAPAEVAYNIYRNGTPVAQNITTTTYNTPITSGVAYTWDVKVACESGGESAPVTVVKQACESTSGCNPPTNLQVAYNANCNTATLTWTEPTGKGAVASSPKMSHDEWMVLYGDKIEKTATTSRKANVVIPTKPEMPTNASKAVIFSEGFEGTTMPNLPTGWTVSTAGKWVTLDDFNNHAALGDDFPAHTGTRMMVNIWNTAGNNWAFSPGFALAAGETYTVSFWYADCGYSYFDEADNFEVRIGQTNTAAGMASAQLVFTQGNIVYGELEWKYLTYNFTPTAGGTYYLGFHDLRPQGPYGEYGLCIAIDDIMVEGGGTTPSNFSYNIYRDGFQIAGPITTNTYNDVTFNNSIGHTWEVKAICATGGESAPAEKTMIACNSAPVVCNDVVLNATNNGDYYDPLPGWYGWSRNILLFEASELDGAGNITDLALYIAQLRAEQRQMNIYLMHTTASTLDATYAWNTMKAQATPVYDAMTSFPTVGWQTFTLDAPFAYDGTQNLLVLVEGTGCTTGGGCAARAQYSTKTNCHWYSRKDATPPDDNALIGTRNSDRPNITFTVCTGGGGGCNPPTNLSVNYDTQCSTAQMSWTAPVGKDGKATQTFSYTGTPQSVELQPGTYEIEVWGADGGTATMGAAGKGGYSKGTITVTTPTTYYVYVGGKGVNTNVPAAGGWNGGGDILGTFQPLTYNGGSGGGGTDIRTTQNTTYDDRIIVGGGGGGATGYGTYTGDGGNGGGLTGEDGGSSRGAAYAGKGGTQTAGGAAATGGISGYSLSGTLGVGGAYSTSGTLGGTAGGGGWYGGGSGHWGGAGGAGSGYIGGVTDGVTINFGGANFVANPDPAGNGYAIITGGSAPGNVAYNIYRNGTPVGTNITTTNYTTPITAGVAYTWEVKAVCPTGGESAAAEVVKLACSGTPSTGDCDPATNLTAAYNAGNCNVNLVWEAPVGKGKSSIAQTLFPNMENKKGERGEMNNMAPALASSTGIPTKNITPDKGPNDYIRWTTGELYDALGVTGGAAWDFIPMSRYTPADLTSKGVASGDLITKVKIGTWYVSTTTFEIYIYQGGTSPTDPGTLLYQQPVTQALVDEAYNEVLLTTPFVIDASQELWVGYRAITTYGFPAGIDGGPVVPNKGDLVFWSGEWRTLSGWAGFPNNWNIETFVQTGSPNVAPAPTSLTVTPNGTALDGTLTWTNPSQNFAGAPLTSITKMVVERNGQHFADVTPAPVGGNMTLPVTVVKEGLHQFTVYAVTSEGNGAKAGTSGIFGDVCDLEVILTPISYYQDSYEWQVTDEDGVKIIGGASYGTFTGIFAGTALFEIAQGGYYADDNVVGVEIKVSGETVYQATLAITDYFYHSEELECAGGDPVYYNVYRNTEPIALNIKKTNYTDAGPFDIASAHTWEVKVVCEEGGESTPVSASLPACDPTSYCDPATNLTAAYIDDCGGALLTWTEPAKKEGGKVITPTILDPSEYVTIPRENSASSSVRNTVPASGSQPADEDPSKALWNVEWSFGVSDLTGEGGNFGIFQWDNKLYISRWSTNPLVGGPNPLGTLYRFAKSGSNWVADGTIVIPGITPNAPLNIEGYATDGEFIYMCNGASTIYKVTPGAWTVAGTISVPGQAIDCIAYDQINDGLWIAEFEGTTARRINWSGAIQQTLTTSQAITDIAWENTSDGTPYLWMLGGGFGVKNLHRWNLNTGAFTANAHSTTDIPNIGSANSGAGLFTGVDMTTGKMVMMGVIEGGPDIAFCYELGIAGDPCPQISNLTYTVNGNDVTLNWTAATGSPTGYEISRSGMPLSTVTATTYTDVMVPSGQYSYSVKAIYPASEDCIPIGVSTPQFIVGNMCEIVLELISTYTSWDGGSISVVVDGQNYGTCASLGFFNIVVPAGEIQFLYDPSYYPCEQGVKIYDFEGEQIFASPAPTSYQVCTPGSGMDNYNGLFFDFENTCGGAATVKYNIYRNGALIAAKHEFPTYTDTDFNPEAGHSWTVKVACGGGTESSGISKILSACLGEGCPPVKNLTAEYQSGPYGANCKALLSWQSSAKERDNFVNINDPKYDFIPEYTYVEKEEKHNQGIEGANLRFAPQTNNPDNLLLSYQNEEVNNYNFFRMPTSELYYSNSTGAVRKGTVASPFPGTSVGSNGQYLQCLEYHNGEIYGIRWNGTVGSGNSFGKINMATGAWTHISSLSNCDGASLCHNPVNGLTYVFPFTGSDTEGTQWGTINLTTGAFTSLGTYLSGSPTLHVAIDNDGIAYAVRGTTTEFGTINLTTGAFTQTATLPFTPNYVQGVDFDRETGELYWMPQSTSFTGTRYYHINKATGVFTQMGSDGTTYSCFTTITVPGELCDPVTNLNATVNGYDVTLTWTAAPGAPTGYEISRNGTPLTTVTGTTYTQTNVPNGSYTYTVKALFAGDCNPIGVSVPVQVKVLPCTSTTELIIGTGTTGSYRHPINTYYNYSYNQMIYDAAELGENGTILSISFQYFYGTAQTGKANQTIYLANSNKSTFASTTDYLPIGEFQQVFSGTIPFNNSNPGYWVTIDLDVPFEYTGGNLVIAFLNSSGTYNTSSNNTFYTHSTTTYKTISAFQDGSAINPVSPPTAGSTGYEMVRPNIKLEVCEIVGGFTIKRDGTILEEGYKSTTYLDDDFDSYDPHTWEVIYVCEDGEESPAMSVTLDPCKIPGDCDPPAELAITYEPDCTAQLDWGGGKGSGKGNTEKPTRPAKVYTDKVIDYNKEELEANLKPRINDGSIIAKPIYEKLIIEDIQKAPKGMVNVTLSANNTWGDNTGYQLLLDQTATQYGITIPVADNIWANCSPPATLYDVFSHKIPTNANPSCYGNVVVTGSVTIQIPAGVYDWCIVNPTPSDKLYIAGNEGDIAGRQDNFVFEDGHAYTFNMILIDDGWSGDGIQYTDEITGDPCPAITNLNATQNGTNVNLSWSAAPAGVINYEVRCDGILLATIASTSYTHIGPNPGMRNYCVSAIYPASNDCIPQSVCQSLMVDEVFDGNCKGVIIGNATTSGYEIPVNTFYRYSYVQHLYDAAELAGYAGKEMTAIAFEYVWTAPNPKEPFAIYVGETTKTTFSGTTDWVPVSQMTLVYEGAINFTNANPWFNIPFDQPYVYGGGNLVVAVLNNEGDYVTSLNPTFRYHAAANKTLHYRVDGTTPINPAAPPTATGVLGNRSNTRFIFCEGLYNIYRDGELIAGEYKGTTYTDFTFDPYEEHTWCVAAICPNEWESEYTCKTMTACAPEPGCTDCIVGTGTATGYQIPINTYYNYSYTQQIYDASEICPIPADKDITHISFQYIHAACVVEKPLVIYLANTTKSVFASTTDWVPISEMELVFDGIVTFSPSSDFWATIELQTPFHYTGDNIVIAVDNNAGNYLCTSSNPTFAYHTTTGNKTIHYYSDSTNPNPAAPPTASGTMTNRNNIMFSACTQLEKDLIALSITGNCQPAANVPYKYTVTVQNRGISTELGTDYVVKVLTSQNVWLGELQGKDIEPQQTIEFEVPVTFTQTGELCVKGRVELIGDQNPVNNSTPQPYTCLNIRPFSDDEIIDIPCDPWTGSLEYQIPFDFYYRNSMVQSVYLNSEINMAGGFIKTVSWFYNNTSTAHSPVTKPVKVYLANTNVNSLTGAWHPQANFTLVYDGTVTIPLGLSQLTVPVQIEDSPDGFLYTGGNLIIMTERQDTEYLDQNIKAFTTGVTPSNRTIRYSNDTQAFSWTQTGTNTSIVSNVELEVKRVPYGIIKGTITDCSNGGVPLEGVFVVLNQYGLSTYTDANGEYIFPFVPAGKDYTISATKFYYHDELAGPFDVIADTEYVYDFCMTLRPGFIVFGVVQGSDESYIEDATLKLTGYDNYQVTTGAFGVFEFEGVLWAKDYTLTVSAPGWATHIEVLDIFGNTNMGTIILYDVPYPPEGVVAEDMNDAYAHIYWSEPIPVTQIAKSYILDDGTNENGLTINANFNRWLGNKFAVDESGVLTSLDIYWMNNPSSTNKPMTVEIFNASQQWVATSEVFSTPSDAWLNIPLNDVPYSGTFYAMVHWEDAPGMCNYVGLDENGPNSAMNLDMRYDGSSWSVCHIFYEESPYVFMIRANAMVDGKSSSYGYKDNITVEPETQVQKSSDFRAEISMADKASIAPIIDKGTPKVHDPLDGIVGYRLWRLLPGQEGNENSWAILTNNPVPAMEYNDYSWANIAPGTYKWAVRTSYNMGVESAPVFSNNLIKLAKVTYTINIVTNSGDSPAGADVMLSNDSYTYHDVAAINSVTFTDVVVGDYTLKITLPGYYDYTVELVIAEPSGGSHLATLIEIVNPPYDLAIDTACHTALLTWNHDRHLNAFTVYLDGNIVAAGITVPEYKFENLPNGTYTAGVQANYSSGNSEIVTINFTINCTVGIHNYESGYYIYPNPATNHLIVERTTTEFATIDIYNAMGMYISSYETGEAVYKISVADLAAGTYFLRITEGSKSTVKSFVKKND